MFLVVFLFHFFQLRLTQEGNSKKIGLIMEKEKKVIVSIKQKEETRFLIEKLSQTELGKDVYKIFEKVNVSSNLFEKLWEKLTKPVEVRRTFQVWVNEMAREKKLFQTYNLQIERQENAALAKKDFFFFEIYKFLSHK